jgi:intracellular multiplication protein IcmL
MAEPPKNPAKAQKAQAQKADPATAGLGTVLVRNEFYRDGYRTLLRVVFGQALAIGVLVLALIFFAATDRTEQTYFATTHDGRLLPMVPLNQPNQSDVAVLAWTTQAMTETFSFSHSDYRRRLQEASRRYFTSQGWAAFTQALQKAQLIDYLEANSQVLTAVPTHAAAIQRQGTELSGGVVRHYWIIEVPLTLTFRALDNRDTRRFIYIVKVVRTQELENPSGIAIEQFLQQN